MHVLVVGAGGVGSAAAPSPCSRPFSTYHGAACTFPNAFCGALIAPEPLMATPFNWQQAFGTP